MKRFFTFALSMVFLLPVFSQVTPNWKVKEGSDFPGQGRQDAVCFVIENVAYVGTGYMNGPYAKDFYKYLPEEERWERIADLPGSVRKNAVAFTANGKGYVGLGYFSDEIALKAFYLKDFYEYTPETNTWKQIEDFPGTGRESAAAFSLNNVGYVGSGGDKDESNLSDFYKYENGKWSQIASLPRERRGSTCFILDSYGYILGGGGQLIAEIPVGMTIFKISGSQH